MRLSNTPKPIGLTQTLAGVWSLYTALVLCALSLYLLPVLLPFYIGTGYIVIHTVMMLCSLLIWLNNKAKPKHILALSIFIILLLLPMQALTSNDAERYLWDGAVFLSGFDPYLIAPDNETVTMLRSQWPTPAEHAEYPTIYPPGALSLFAISASAGPSYGFWVWKAIASLAAIVTLVLAYDLLRLRSALRNLSLIALNPLLLLETGVAGHLDIFCALGVIAALWSFEKDKIIMTGIIIGLAASIKFLPAVIAGPLLFYTTPRKSVKLFLSSSLTWALIYAAMFGFGYKPLGLLPTFFEKWRGGAPLYPILEFIASRLKLSQSSFLIGLSTMAAIGFGMSAWLTKKQDIYTAIIVALTVPLLLSPVLFSWYLLALVPLIALKPNATLIIAVSCTPLSYVVLNKWLSQGIWQPEVWPSIILFLGIIIGIVFDTSYARKNNRIYKSTNP